MNISSQTIKTLIATNDIAVLDLLKEVKMDSVLRKISFTRPLSEEEVLKQHGLDVVVIYMSICNEHDGEIISEDLKNYLVSIQ